MFSSPLDTRLCSVDVGLPRGFRTGDSLKPLTDPELLMGGEVSPPWDDTGDLIGEGDRLLAPRDEIEVSPARCIDSRLPATPEEGPCSAWTTSAKEMKLSRRTSVESSEP